MISQLSRNHTDKSETYSSQYYPNISNDSILKLSEMSYFVLNNQILQGFHTEIDKINSKIEIWIRKQWVFVFAYKDMVQNYADSKQLIDRDQYPVASDKEVLSKKLYNKLMPNSCKQNLKRKERMFWEDDRSFKCQRSAQNIQIPSADEWDLKFTDENEAEISQILYFGYSSCQKKSTSLTKKSTSLDKKKCKSDKKKYKSGQKKSTSRTKKSTN